MFQKTEPEKKLSDRGWLTLDQMAAAFLITPQAFSKSVRPLIDPKDVREEKKRIRIRCRGAIDAWAEKEADKARIDARKNADPLLVGSDSPGLEEYRKHKARIAKVEADEREKLAVQVSVIAPLLFEAMGSIRRSLEIVEREFGRNAVTPTVESIDEAIRTIKKHFSNGINGANATLSDVGGPEAAAFENDEGIR